MCPKPGALNICCLICRQFVLPDPVDIYDFQFVVK